MRGGDAGEVVVVVVAASRGVVMVWFRWMVVDSFGIRFLVGTLCRRVLYKGVGVV
ncbi:transmembrane protein, putative [Medicago truncatula]|uniref:Transmembrane protein, putative n=1 Tax=Medicago truncatula TaxID=3880 RepID=A0A072UF70_MEDTR|nr:transmembrane protein, putative [Medicago truncatula]